MEQNPKSSHDSCSITIIYSACQLFRHHKDLFDSFKVLLR